MQDLTYYKVVTPALKSAWVNKAHMKFTDLEVQYTVGEWTYPKDNTDWLCCFEGRDNARQWAQRTNTKLMIFSCEIEELKTERKHPFIDPWPKKIFKFLQGEQYYGNSEMKIPVGSVFASKIKLLELQYTNTPMYLMNDITGAK